MLLHLHTVEVVQKELRNAFNDDRVVPVEKRLRSVERELLLDVFGREQVVANEDVLHEYFLKLVFVSVHDAELLEGLKVATVASTASAGSFTKGHHRHIAAKLVLSPTMTFEIPTRCGGDATRPRAFKKVDFIRIDNSVVFAPYFEVVGD